MGVELNVKYNQQIEDEGIPLPKQPTINFIGAGVVVTNGAGKTVVSVPSIGNLQDWQPNTVYNTGTYVVAVYENEYRLWRAMSNFTSGSGSFPAGNTIATPLNSYVGQWREVSPLRGSTLDVTFSGSISYNSSVTPPILTGNVNNYNPAGLQYCNFLRLSSTGNFNVTGLQQPVGNVNQNIFIVNVGTNNITLNNEDANSLVANRFLFGSGAGANKTLQVNEGIMLIYDNISTKWRSQAIQI